MFTIQLICAAIAQGTQLAISISCRALAQLAHAKPIPIAVASPGELIVAWHIDSFLVSSVPLVQPSC